MDIQVYPVYHKIQRPLQLSHLQRPLYLVYIYKGLCRCVIQDTKASSSLTLSHTGISTQDTKAFVDVQGSFALYMYRALLPCTSAFADAQGSFTQVHPHKGHTIQRPLQMQHLQMQRPLQMQPLQIVSCGYPHKGCKGLCRCSRCRCASLCRCTGLFC